MSVPSGRVELPGRTGLSGAGPTGCSSWRSVAKMEDPDPRGPIRGPVGLGRGGRPADGDPVRGPGRGWQGAGEDGAIKRFIEHLNPLGARVVAVEKPTEAEKSRWYLPRFVQDLPNTGEINLLAPLPVSRSGDPQEMGEQTRSVV